MNSAKINKNGKNLFQDGFNVIIFQKRIEKRMSYQFQ